MKIIILLLMFVISSCSTSLMKVHKRQTHIGSSDSVFDLLPYSEEDKRAILNLDIKEDIVIAVIDSGINCEDPRLKGRIWIPEELKGKYPCGVNIVSRTQKDEYVFDFEDHGHKVATLLLGIHPRIKIFPIKAQAGRGYSVASQSLAASELIVKYKDKIKVVNFSSSGSNYTETENRAIKLLHENGINLITSAGNRGWDRVHATSQLSRIYKSMIVVGSSNRFYVEPEKYSNYSSRDVHAFTVGNHYTYNKFGFLREAQGTSYATPIISAIVSLARSAYPYLTNEELRDMVINSSPVHSNFKGRNVANGEFNIAKFLKLIDSQKRQLSSVK